MADGASNRPSQTPNLLPPVSLSQLRGNCRTTAQIPIGRPPGGVDSGTLSSGCSATNVATGAAIDATIMVGGQERTYRLSVRADYVPSEPLPLVFGLNGVGGDGVGAQQAFGLETNRRAIFVYPDSLYDESLGTVAWEFSSTGHDGALFDALITELTEGYCLSRTRTRSATDHAASR